MNLSLEDDFRCFGYPTDDGCEVCGGKPGSSEPRFGYVVCINHFQLSPLQVSDLRGTQISKTKPTMSKELLKVIREKFTTKLQEKTGWGRNELIKKYDEAVNEAILELA